MINWQFDSARSLVHIYFLFLVSTGLISKPIPILFELRNECIFHHIDDDKLHGKRQIEASNIRVCKLVLDSREESFIQTSHEAQHSNMHAVKLHFE